MKKTLLVMLAVMPVLFSCGKRIKGEGAITEKTFVATDFSGVSLEGDVDVTVREGNASVNAKGYENLLPYVSVTVSEGILKVKMDDAQNYDNNNIQVEVTMPALSKVLVVGSGTAGIHPFSNLTDLDLTISGSGGINAVEPLLIRSLTASISGSGNIVLKGMCDSQKINVAGSGSFLADELFTQTTDVSVAGSGDVNVNVTSALNVEIAGSGDVTYLGSPKVTEQITGSGKLNGKK